MPTVQHVPFAFAKSVLEKVACLVIRDAGGFRLTFLDVSESKTRARMLGDPLS